MGDIDEEFKAAARKGRETFWPCTGNADGPVESKMDPFGCKRTDISPLEISLQDMHCLK